MSSTKNFSGTEDEIKKKNDELTLKDLRKEGRERKKEPKKDFFSFPSFFESLKSVKSTSDIKYLPATSLFFFENHEWKARRRCWPAAS